MTDTATDVDPFAVDDEPFDDTFDLAGGAAFVKMEDLLGRLLLIKPTSIGERESTIQGAKPGDTYEYVECDVVVLDGEPTELIESVPTVLEAFQFSGAVVVSSLKPKLRNGKRLLGRLGQHKAKQFKTSMGWHFDPPSDVDQALARSYLASTR
jgi:hypothetical protein